MTRRVVVTGVGVVSPIGNDAATMWRHLIAGTSGIGPITQFDATAFDSRIAGEVKAFDAARYQISPKEQKRMERFVQFAVASIGRAHV